MSLSKFKLLQPTIIKFRYSYDIPKPLRNQYVINFNAVGIEWFVENFIMLETGKGFLMQENGLWDKNKDREPIKLLLENDGSTKFDIPRVYIIIKEEYLDDDSKIFDFIQQSLANTALYGTGTKDMIAGIDFFVNETLYKYLTRTTDAEGNQIHPYIPVTSDITVPNYLNEDGELDYEIYEDLSSSESDYVNLEYYFKKNKALVYNFSQDDLENICQTFPRTILELTNISEEDLLEPKNQVYKATLEYFANGKTDCGSRMLQLVLGTNFTTPNTAMSYLDSCGNCSSNNGSNQTAESCLELYDEAMKQSLKSMFGDPEFYEDWMMNEMGDSLVPNGCLIQNLKDLLESYNEYEKNMSGKNKKSSKKNCGCGNINSKSGNSNDGEEAINDMGEILDFLCDDDLDANKNKTKIYGEEFGEWLAERCS